jgi:hypothetical protein
MSNLLFLLASGLNNGAIGPSYGVFGGGASGSDASVLTAVTDVYSYSGNTVVAGTSLVAATDFIAATGNSTIGVSMHILEIPYPLELIWELLDKL